MQEGNCFTCRLVSSEARRPWLSGSQLGAETCLHILASPRCSPPLSNAAGGPARGVSRPPLLYEADNTPTRQAATTQASRYKHL